MIEIKMQNYPSKIKMDFSEEKLLLFLKDAISMYMDQLLIISNNH